MTASADDEGRRWRLALAASTLPQALSASGALALPELDRVWGVLARYAERGDARRRDQSLVHRDDHGLPPSRRWEALLGGIESSLDRSVAWAANVEKLDELENVCVHSLFVASTFLSLEVQELASPAVASADARAERRRRAALRVSDNLARELLEHVQKGSWWEMCRRQETRGGPAVTPLQPAPSPGNPQTAGLPVDRARTKPDHDAVSPDFAATVSTLAQISRHSQNPDHLSKALKALAIARAARPRGRHYEVVVILDPSLDERIVAPLLEPFLDVVRDDGGFVENLDVWGRRRLLYETENYAEGIYAVLDMTCEPETIKEMDRQLALNESVLRTKVMRRNDIEAPRQTLREA